MVGMEGLAPPRLPDSESGPSAVRVKPHARNWRSRQESHLQPPRSKRGALVLELRKRKGRRKIAKCRSPNPARAESRTPPEILQFAFSLRNDWCSDRDSHPDLRA